MAEKEGYIQGDCACPLPAPFLRDKLPQNPCGQRVLDLNQPWKAGEGPRTGDEWFSVQKAKAEPEQCKLRKEGELTAPEREMPFSLQQGLLLS